jgi:large subunit ribosomal protein L6
MPISVPSGVTLEWAGRVVTAKGPKGQLTRSFPELISFSMDGGEFKVARFDDSKKARERHGLSRTLVANMVTGVSKGFEKKLSIVGVGYKAAVKGSTLNLILGYSHPINYTLPEGIQASVDKQNNITVTGIDKEVVGQTAAKIRSFRKPDAYKGKGIRYTGEVLRLKAGKSGAK